MFGLGEKKGDPDGAGAKPLDGAAASAVVAASEQVKSKRGGFRPGSGRKPGTGGSVVGSAAPGKEIAPAPHASEADVEFVRTIAEAGLKILDRVETNIIIGLIDQIGDASIKEKTEGFLRQREIGPGDYEIVVNACGAMAAKYAVLSRYAPEMALLSWASIHAMAVTGVMNDLKKLAVVVKKIKTASDADSPQAD